MPIAPFTNSSLSRYVDAQSDSYNSALIEIKLGKKTGHWMWFIFPQIKGLGSSSTSEYYGIQSREEAEAYLLAPVLGKRLIECSSALLSISGVTGEEIFGYPDVLKLKSSMTLFECVSSDHSVFSCFPTSLKNIIVVRGTPKLLSCWATKLTSNFSGS